MYIRFKYLPQCLALYRLTVNYCFIYIYIYVITIYMYIYNLIKIKLCLGQQISLLQL